MLALLKLGFRYDEILDMPEQDAEEFVSVYMKLTGAKESKKTYLVKKH